VLKALEELGCQITALSGTSAGGIVGAVYAAGYSPQEMLEAFSKIDQQALFGRNTNDNPSLLGVTGVQKALEQLLGERTFEDLEIPFAVTATDIDRGREVIIRHGCVLDAVLATIAIPGVLPHQNYAGVRLVDGGVLDPVPVSVVRYLNPYLPVAAVVLSQPPEEADYEAILTRLPGPEAVARQLARLRITQAINIFLQSIDIGTRAITEMRLKIDHPDVVIRPRIKSSWLTNDVDIQALASTGEQATRELTSEILQAFTWQRNVVRRLRYGNLKTVAQEIEDA
jgi:NTE family protein